MSLRTRLLLAFAAVVLIPFACSRSDSGRT